MDAIDFETLDARIDTEHDFEGPPTTRVDEPTDPNRTTLSPALRSDSAAT
jgi:hypothetical protein